MLVSVIGDAFRVSKKEETHRVGRDIKVEALQHKVSPELSWLFFFSISVKELTELMKLNISNIHESFK